MTADTKNGGAYDVKPVDVVALGELLIDFTENGSSTQGNPLLEANPGGAPCNVLAMLNRLGRKTAFIGKVGCDTFGRQLRQAVEDSGTDTTNLVEDKNVHTTLAFVHTLPDGDRSFSFYRNPGADMMLRKDEVMPDVVTAGRIFHFGTLSCTHAGVREATRYAVHLAKEHGMLLSFDPNLREPLWDALEDARREMIYGLEHCDILKISDNELTFITGETDLQKGAEQLRQQYDIPLVLVTLGANGSRAYYKDIVVEEPAFLQQKTIETTGAGDTFTGCMLHFVLQYGMEHLTEEILHDMLRFANAGASLITTRKGALKVMPTKQEIEMLLMDSHCPEVAVP